MSFSVTKNASAVADVMSLLSSLGFDAGSQDGHSELVIDRFDQWTNSTNNVIYASPTGCGIYFMTEAVA